MDAEERLLINLKKRKHGSLEKAIDIYTPYVSVIIYNIIGSAMTKEDVEEAVSDTFVSLWRSVERLDSGKGCIRTYLSAVARNCARKKLRERTLCGELDENTAAVSGEPSERLEAEEEREMLLALIRGLGEPDSEVFIRRYWYGEKISAIAAATGICKSTVATKLQRGREKLKELLLKEEGQ